MLRRLLVPLLVILLAGCGVRPIGAPLSAPEAARLAAKAADIKHAKELDKAIDGIAVQRSSSNNAVTLHIDGKAAFGALEELIRTAKTSLWIETFIWHNDETGIRIAQLLRKRALEGLDVRILVDTLGTQDQPTDRNVLRILQDYRVPMRLFNPKIADGFNVHVTHRKLYLADGDHGLTGGMNIGDEYAKEWHDMLVEAKGAVARQMHVEFADEWSRSGDGPEEKLTIPPLNGNYGTKPARIVVTSPRQPERAQELKKALWAAIGAATKKIRLQHVYFSNEDLITQAIAAAKRGVEVEVLLPTKNDFEVFRYVNRHYAGKLADVGASIRFYDERFSHIKYFSADGALNLIGSANGDDRSFYENQELSMVCTDPEFVQDSDKRLFESDWAKSRIPTYADLHVPLHWKPIVSLAQILSYYL